MAIPGNSIRIPPEEAPHFRWSMFEVFCDEQKIGTHPDDWKEWWVCWKRGFQAGRV